MSPYPVGLVVGVAFILFGVVHAVLRSPRNLLGSTWIDGAVLAFIGANVLVFTYFGLHP